MNRRGSAPFSVPAFLVLAAFAGGMVAARPLVAGRFDPYHKLAIFTKVLSYIENNYVEDISESELMYGAARGLTEVLDPHSRFMDPEEYEKLKQETEGNAEIIGIGIDLEKRKRGFVVVSPIEGSPAWRAGIESGDLIERIDGVEAGPLDWNDAIARIQGPAGSEVVLSILRRGRALTFHIKREKFEVKAVEWRMLADGYGYIKLRVFSSIADAKVLEGLEDIQKQTAEDRRHQGHHPRRAPQPRRSARPGRQGRRPLPVRRAHRAHRGQGGQGDGPPDRAQPRHLAGLPHGGAGRRRHRLGRGDSGRRPAGPRARRGARHARPSARARSRP